MKSEQLELLPTKRVQLLPDEPAAPKGVVVGDAYLDGIMKRQVTARVKLTTSLVSTDKRLKARNGALGDIKKFAGAIPPNEDDDGTRTNWTSCKEDPPWCTGFWEVNSREYKKPFDRIWFDKVLDGWVMPDSGQLIKSADMHLHYRGLKQPAQDYDYFVPGMSHLDQVLLTINKPAPAKRVVLL
jgi:hypothetical protein